MKRALVASALVLSASTCLAASSKGEEQAEMVQGLVRIIGAQAGITLYCRKTHTIDDKVSDGLLRTVRPTLDKAIGHRQAQAAIDEEGQRLTKEIAEIGADRWCADQRDIFNADGVSVFLDRMPTPDRSHYTSAQTTLKPINLLDRITGVTDTVVCRTLPAK